MLFKSKEEEKKDGEKKKLSFLNQIRRIGQKEEEEKQSITTTLFGGVSVSNGNLIQQKNTIV